VLSEKWLIFIQILQMTDIHFMYGRAKGNASKAIRLYHAAYWRIADSQEEECLAKFINAYVRPDNSYQIYDCGRPRLIRTPAFEENILRTIEENPGTSCRRITLQERSSHHTV